MRVQLNLGSVRLAVATLGLAVLLVMATLTAIAANTIAWQLASTGLPTTGLVRDVEFGDVNNDGKPDAVVVGVGGFGVRVYAGNGAGVWSSSGMTVGLPVGGAYDGVALGDLNTDGKLDIAVTGASNNGVVVWHGDGAGAWTPITTGLPGAGNGSFIGLALGDVNLDGRLDVIAGGNGGVAAGIKVYLNNTSSFSQTTSPTTTGSYPHLAAGYIDVDGYVDIAGGNSSTGVRAWRGGSNNSWTQASTGLSTTTGFRGVTLGDVDNDGKSELIASRMGFTNSNGGGLFAFDWSDTAYSWSLAPNPIPLTGSYDEIDLADLNNDGWLDLIAAAASTQGTSGLATFLGSPTGFSSTPSPTSTGALASMAAADFDRDGLMDLGAGDEANLGASAWRSNGVRDPIGSWTLIASPQITGSPRALAYGDINRDGDLDIVFSRASGGLNMYLGDGGNAWAYCPFFNVAGGAYTGTYESAIVGPWDRFSQYPQIIGGRSDNGGIQYFGNVTNNCGYFYSYQVTTTGSYRGLSAADIDNDDHLDLVAAPSQLINIGLRLWEENGVSSWQLRPNPVSTGTFCDTALGDLNHTGDDEIAAADCGPSGGAGVKVFIQGRAGWSSQTITSTGEYYAIAIGDLNNDGHPDVVAAKNGISTSVGIDVWLNNGTATGWTEWPSPASAGQYFDLDLGDVNHDGWLDILAARDGLGVSVWLGNGAGGWTSSSTNLPTSGAFFRSLFGHVDHDGNLDILSTGLNQGVRIWTAAEAAPPTINNIQPSGWISTTQSPTLTANVLDTGSGISTTSGLYRFSTNGGGTWSSYLPASISGSTGSTSTQVMTALAVPFNQNSGTQNRIEFRASDMVGNVGLAQAVIKIDTTPPTPPTVITPTDHTVNVWSNDTTVSISWAGATDATSGLNGYSILFNQSASTLPDTSVESFATSFSGLALADAANWYVHIRSRDLAGNWSTTAKHLGPFKIDTTPPSNPTTFGGSHTLGVWDNDPTVFVNWSGATDTGGSGVHGYSYSWTALSNSLPDTTEDTTGISDTSPTLGSSNSQWFHVRTRDNAGNWSATAAHRGAFYIDTALPSSSVNSPASSNSTSFSVFWSGSDAHSGIDNYDVQYRDKTTGGAWTTWKSATSSTSSTFNGTSGHIYEFRSRARDNAGNVEAYPGSADLTTEVRTIDVFVLNPGIEVNQAVQDLSNSVKLIAQKRTFVRCYVQSDSGNIASVNARLRVYRDNGATYMGSLSPANSGATITVRSSPDRAQLDHAYYFDVPTGWLTAGNNVKFECEINLPKKYAENDYSNNLRSVTVDFVNSPVMNIAMIDVDYSYGGSVRHVRSVDRTRLAKWLRTAYPIRTLNVYYGYLDPAYDSLPDVDTVNSDLAWNKAQQVFGAGEDQYWRYYGQALKVDKYTFMRGKSVGTPGNVAAGPTGDTSGWDPDGNFGDWYGGHENGHSYGRAHVTGAPNDPDTDAGCGDEAGPDGSYPYAQGRMSPGTGMWTNTTLYGFDWSLTTPFVVPPTWYDVMTYCPGQWISDYTYEAIYARMILEKPVLRPIGLASVEYLAVFGQIVTSTNAVTLNTFYRVPDGSDVFGRDLSGTYHIKLLNAANTPLADYNFSPRGTVEPDSPAQLITELVPWVTDTRKIVIASATQRLITRTVSTNTPTVTLQAPAGGITLTGNSVSVSWSAFDADSAPLTFWLEYSQDGGATWQPLSGQIQSTTIQIDLTLLPGGTQGKFRVWVSDGVNTATDETNGTFVVPNKAPQILSIDPISGTTYVVSQTISFDAITFDPEDQQLPDGNLQWSSDRDGVLGTGSLLQLDTLSIGIHAITLTATDSDAAQATQTFTVIVTAEPAIIEAFVYLPLILKNN
jgi:hypothetical protein